MGCNHCMVNATPDGAHMTVEVFNKSLDFIERNQLMLLMVSGGEPVDHPQFFELMDLVKGRDIPAKILLSNGMFLENEEVRTKVLALGMMVQVTNDPRYYPKRITKFEHPLVGYEDHIRTITALGRAKENDIPSDRLAPMCFNLRSCVRSLGNLQAAIMHLRMSEKFCTPSINVDGSMVAGEAPGCCKIGTVDSTNAELVENLKTMRCNRCGLEDGLAPMYRHAIGLPIAC